jgi:pimeloyl-ACP methyl ester carboxylesterase
MAANPDEPARAILDPRRLAELTRRLDLSRPSASASASVDWERGVAGDWLTSLLEDWRARDPAALQDRLDASDQRRVTVDGQSLHVLVAQGVGPDPLALLLTHGWPGSLLEHLDVIGPLSDPAAHGGDPADAFTVIVPTLPGFGFSAPPPPGGFTASQVARLWRAMMATLGHDRYVAHGSDLGAGVTAWLARVAPEAVAAIHLATPGLTPAPPPHGEAEARFAQEAASWVAREGGYAHMHATKPATLAVALTDSPAGLAAWIGEKVVAWSSVDADGSPKFDRDRLLDTLTLYWATDTIGTSLAPYWAAAHAPGGPLPVDDRSPVATAVSNFGGERIPLPKPPRELAERYYTVTHWAEHDHGGHFPAVAEPELLVRTLREVFRPYR